jgi:hypothetical protein
VDEMRDPLRPQVRWVPVVDARGRRHMEMRWSLTGATGTAAPAA